MKTMEKLNQTKWFRFQDRKIFVEIQYDRIKEQFFLLYGKIVTSSGFGERNDYTSLFHWYVYKETKSIVFQDCCDSEHKLKHMQNLTKKLCAKQSPISSIKCMYCMTVYLSIVVNNFY